jgi:hypothetical protein
MNTEVTITMYSFLLKLSKRMQPAGFQAGIDKINQEYFPQGCGCHVLNIDDMTFSVTFTVEGKYTNEQIIANNNILKNRIETMPGMPKGGEITYRCQSFNWTIPVPMNVQQK